MKYKYILVLLAAISASFIGGFMLANSLNKAEFERLSTPIDKPRNETNAAPVASGETTLSDDEIRQRIAEADENPANFDFQKNLGMSLYRYAAMKRDIGLMGESARLLTRALSIVPTDYDLKVDLGNVYLDIAYVSGEKNSFASAREFYRKALTEKPNDVDVITAYGLTFFLADPSRTTEAIAEFERALKLDPNHEPTLQAMSEALIAAKRPAEAGKLIERLEKVNPDNTYLPGLKRKMSAATIPGK